MCVNRVHGASRGIGRRRNENECSRGGGGREKKRPPRGKKKEQRSRKREMKSREGGQADVKMQEGEKETAKMHQERERESNAAKLAALGVPWCVARLNINPKKGTGGEAE